MHRLAQRIDVVWFCEEFSSTIILLAKFSCIFWQHFWVILHRSVQDDDGLFLYRWDQHWRAFSISHYCLFRVQALFSVHQVNLWELCHVIFLFEFSSNQSISSSYYFLPWEILFNFSMYWFDLCLCPPFSQGIALLFTPILWHFSISLNHSWFHYVYFVLFPAILPVSEDRL